MLYNSPEYADARLILGVRRPNGPAVVDPSPLAAAYTAKQSQNLQNVTENRQALGLGSERLAQNQRQFDTNLGLQRADLDYGKRAGNTASLLALGGLGVGALGNIPANKRFEEQIKIRDDMIDQLNKAGDEKSLYFANFLRYLE